MTPSSRYLRPGDPVPIRLQSRDRVALRELYRYRHLTSAHLHWLAFAGIRRKTATGRLRRLWEHQYLERLFLPFVLDQRQPIHPLASRPIYTLGHRGLKVLAEERGVAVTALAAEPPSVVTLEHNLEAAGFVAAVAAAARTRPGLQLVADEPEPELWARLTSWRREHARRTPFLVPDGAVTLSDRSGKNAQTFYLEVVRADVRGGNQTLLQKLKRYAALHHERFFREVYGHERLRAVLVATTSPARAERLRALATRLEHGRRLFWFGSYLTVDERGRAISVYTPMTVLDPRWTAVDGSAQAIAPAAPLTVGPDHSAPALPLTSRPHATQLAIALPEIPPTDAHGP